MHLETAVCPLSGLLSTAGYAVYAQHVAVEYFNPNFDDLKWVTKQQTAKNSSWKADSQTFCLTSNRRYDLGTPLFLGWVGSGFHTTGGFFYLWSVCTPLCGGKETWVPKHRSSEWPNRKVNQQLPCSTQLQLCSTMLFNVSPYRLKGIQTRCLSGKYPHAFKVNVSICRFIF